MELRFSGAADTVDICTETPAGARMFCGTMSAAVAEYAADVDWVPTANGDAKGSTICTITNTIVAKGRGAPDDFLRFVIVAYFMNKTLSTVVLINLCGSCNSVSFCPTQLDER
jgi:hypothetical protein